MPAGPLDHEQAAVATLRARHRGLDARQLGVALEDVRAGPRRGAHYTTAYGARVAVHQAPDHRSRHLARPRGVDRHEQAARGRRVAHQARAPRRDAGVEGARSPRRTRGCGGCRRIRRARPRACACAPSSAGTAPASICAATPLSRASACRWPSRPKPVTSVIAEAPAATAAAPALGVERRHRLAPRAPAARRRPARACGR